MRFVKRSIGLFLCVAAVLLMAAALLAAAVLGKKKTEEVPAAEHPLYGVIDRCFFMTSTRLSEEASGSGLEIRFTNAGEDEGSIHVLSAEELTDSDALCSPVSDESMPEEKRRDAFLSAHPDMVSYAAYDSAYHVLTEDTSVLYCRYEGAYWRIAETNARDGALADAVRFAAGLGYEPQCTYQRYENGDDAWDNRRDGRLAFRRDIGEGTELEISMEKTGETETEGRQEDILTASVRRGGETAPLQTLEVRTQQYEFRFEDFNCDGYEDLTAVEYYGAGSGSAQHFLWDPDGERFLEADASLSAYTGYSMDPASRRLHIYRESSVLNEEGRTVRWTGTDEYEPVSGYRFALSDDWKTLRAETELYGRDGIHVSVSAEYDYDCAQYFMEELRGLAELELAWEDRITLRDGARTCRLICGEDHPYIGGVPAGDAYLQTLYVLDEDGRFLRRLYVTSGAPLEKAESAGGEQGTLTLIFQDGTRTVIGEKELLGELPEEEAAQLAAFAASPERWLAKLPDAGLYYYYAVTDLDADGQLEIPLVCLDAEGGAQLCAVTEYAGDGEFVSVSPEPAGKALLDGAGPRILDITEYSNGPAYFGAAGKTSGPAADEADPESRRGGRSFYLMWGNRYTRDDRKHFLTGSALAAEEEKLLQIPLVERFVETDDRGHRSCSDSWAETGEDGLPGEMKPAEEDRLFGAAQERIRTFAGEDLQRGYYQIKWHADFVWEQGGPLEIETEEESAVKALLESLYRGWRAGSLEAILSDR